MSSSASDTAGAGNPPDGRHEPDPCDRCGLPGLAWRKCKLVCSACGSINKTCADL